MKPRNLENDRRGIHVKKVMHTYSDTIRVLGMKMDWSVWLCIYRKDIEAERRADTMNLDVQRSRLCKRVRDNETWQVLFHPLSQMWINEKEDNFRIVFKNSDRIVTFGKNKDGKPFMKTFSKEEQ